MTYFIDSFFTRMFLYLLGMLAIAVIVYFFKDINRPKNNAEDIARPLQRSPKNLKRLEELYNEYKESGKDPKPDDTPEYAEWLSYRTKRDAEDKPQC